MTSSWKQALLMNNLNKTRSPMVGETTVPARTLISPEVNIVGSSALKAPISEVRTPGVSPEILSCGKSLAADPKAKKAAKAAVAPKPASDFWGRFHSELDKRRKRKKYTSEEEEEEEEEEVRRRRGNTFDVFPFSKAAQRKQEAKEIHRKIDEALKAGDLSVAEFKKAGVKKKADELEALEAQRQEDPENILEDVRTQSPPAGSAGVPKPPPMIPTPSTAAPSSNALKVEKDVGKLHALIAQYHTLNAQMYVVVTQMTDIIAHLGCDQEHTK